MEKNYTLVNADTDSVMVCKPDQSVWTKEEQELFLTALNEQFPEKIKWEHDGIYDSVVVIKSKNYALLPEGETKVKLKGSGIKDQKKEPALKEMMARVIDILIKDGANEAQLVNLYHEYIKEALNPKDISRWCQKKTVSESIFNCEGYEDLDEEDDDNPRKNELDIWKAVQHVEGLQQGDKVYLYPVYLGKQTKQVEKFKKNKETGEKISQGMTDKQIDVYGLKRIEEYNSDVATDKLIKRVYDTLNIFKTVIDMKLFIKYHNKTNSTLLEGLKNG